MKFNTQKNKLIQFKNKSYLLSLLYFINNLILKILIEALCVSTVLDIGNMVANNIIPIFIIPFIIFIFLIFINIRIGKVPPHQFKICNIGLNFLLVFCSGNLIFNIYMILKIF